MWPIDPTLAPWMLAVQLGMLALFGAALIGAALLVGLACQLASAIQSRSNCLIEARRLQRERGGYILLRPSRELAGVPHALWLPAEAVETHPELRSFVPLEIGRRRLPKPTDLVFDGATKRCDLHVCTRALPQCPECEWYKKIS